MLRAPFLSVVIIPTKPTNRFVRRLRRIPSPYPSYAIEKHANEEHPKDSYHSGSTIFSPQRRLIRYKQSVDLYDAPLPIRRGWSTPGEYSCPITFSVRSSSTFDSNNIFLAIRSLLENDVTIGGINRVKCRVSRVIKNEWSIINISRASWAFYNRVQWRRGNEMLSNNSFQTVQIGI